MIRILPKSALYNGRFKSLWSKLYLLDLQESTNHKEKWSQILRNQALQKNNKIYSENLQNQESNGNDGTMASSTRQPMVIHYFQPTIDYHHMQEQSSWRNHHFQNRDSTTPRKLQGLYTENIMLEAHSVMFTSNLTNEIPFIDIDEDDCCIKLQENITINEIHLDPIKLTGIDFN